MLGVQYAFVCKCRRQALQEDNGCRLKESLTIKNNIFLASHIKHLSFSVINVTTNYSLLLTQYITCKLRKFRDIFLLKQRLNERR